MSISQPNAFSDHDGAPHAYQQSSKNRGPASALAPLQAEIQQHGDHWRLVLSPMRAFDAMRCLAGLSNDDEAVVLLFSVDHAAGDRAFDLRRPRTGLSKPSAARLAALAAKHAIPVIESFECNALALDPAAACEVVGMICPARVRAVLVNGPIESRDARAIIKAAEQGEVPLSCELRAVASVEIEADRVVRLWTREKDHALRPVAENFRHYLAAVRRCSHNEHAAPECWQLERLFSVSGTLTVRPIETEVYSTSMDIGISTSPVEVSKPADRSLIYDLPSNTWHDEP